MQQMLTTLITYSRQNMLGLVGSLLLIIHFFLLPLIIAARDFELRDFILVLGVSFIILNSIKLKNWYATVGISFVLIYLLFLSLYATTI